MKRKRNDTEWNGWRVAFFVKKRKTRRKKLGARVAQLALKIYAFPHKETKPNIKKQAANGKRKSQAPGK